MVAFSERLDPWVLCCLDPLEWLLAQCPHPIFIKRQRGLCKGFVHE